MTDTPTQLPFKPHAEGTAPSKPALAAASTEPKRETKAPWTGLADTNAAPALMGDKGPSTCP